VVIGNYTDCRGESLYFIYGGKHFELAPISFVQNVMSTLKMQRMNVIALNMKQFTPIGNEY